MGVINRHKGENRSHGRHEGVHSPYSSSSSACRGWTQCCIHKKPKEWNFWDYNAAAWWEVWKQAHQHSKKMSREIYWKKKSENLLILMRTHINHLVFTMCR